MLNLIVINGPQRGRVCHVQRTQPVTIGRRDAELELNDSRVSRKHARIAFAAGQWWVEDLGSSNGTWVNAQRIATPTALGEGDQLQIGRFRLVVGHVAAEPEPDTPAPTGAADDTPEEAVGDASALRHEEGDASVGHLDAAMDDAHPAPPAAEPPAEASRDDMALDAITLDEAQAGDAAPDEPRRNEAFTDEALTDQAHPEESSDGDAAMDLAARAAEARPDELTEAPSPDPHAGDHDAADHDASADEALAGSALDPEAPEQEAPDQQAPDQQAPNDESLNQAAPAPEAPAGPHSVSVSKTPSSPTDHATAIADVDSSEICDPSDALDVTDELDDGPGRAAVDVPTVMDDGASRPVYLCAVTWAQSRAAHAAEAADEATTGADIADMDAASESADDADAIAIDDEQRDVAGRHAERADAVAESAIADEAPTAMPRGRWPVRRRRRRVFIGGAALLLIGAIGGGVWLVAQRPAWRQALPFDVAALVSGPPESSAGERSANSAAQPDRRAMADRAGSEDGDASGRNTKRASADAQTNAPRIDAPLPIARQASDEPGPPVSAFSSAPRLRGRSVLAGRVVGRMDETSETPGKGRGDTTGAAATALEMLEAQNAQDIGDASSTPDDAERVPRAPAKPTTRDQPGGAVKPRAARADAGNGASDGAPRETVKRSAGERIAKTPDEPTRGSDASNTTASDSIASDSTTSDSRANAGARKNANREKDSNASATASASRDSIAARTAARGDTDADAVSQRAATNDEVAAARPSTSKTETSASSGQPIAPIDWPGLDPIASALPAGDELADGVSDVDDGGVPGEAAAASPARVVYVVDASGSMIDTLPQLLDWLSRQVAMLDEQQRFTIVFCRADEAREAPPAGLKRATEAMKRRVRDWLSPGRQRITPQGKSGLATALEHVAQYRVSAIYLLCDGPLPIRAGADGPATPAQVAALLGDAPPRLHTVQFFYQRGEASLRALADRFDGQYHFVRPKRRSAQTTPDWLGHAPAMR